MHALDEAAVSGCSSFAAAKSSHLLSTRTLFGLQTGGNIVAIPDSPARGWNDYGPVPTAICAVVPSCRCAGGQPPLLLLRFSFAAWRTPHPSYAPSSPNRFRWLLFSGSSG